MDDGAWRRSRRQPGGDEVKEAADAQWTSFDVWLPALTAGTVTGALHFWTLRPPAILRKSVVAAAGACMGTLLVGCFVNVRRDARAIKNSAPPMQPELARSWDDDDHRPAYTDDLPRGQRLPRKSIGLKNFRMDDA
ncbi:uncharacterized protein LOC125945197 [Dermacentor silvarum]|uniref:uncharacterized protein LOC125945197 n=1 Tax=Dermacentor silvarum TaxID=543639 RepID=UPI002100D65C|nr:uncharacterized protein LOC125945197 [Dermacentor silvarum]